LLIIETDLNEKIENIVYIAPFKERNCIISLPQSWLEANAKTTYIAIRNISNTPTNSKALSIIMKIDPITLDKRQNLKSMTPNSKRDKLSNSIMYL
jgi:hypothetical protein